MSRGLFSFSRTHPVMQTQAIWHSDAGVPREQFVVVHFRKRFTLPAAAANPVFWVSASQRFILYLDGRLVARGPARSDPARWQCMAVRPGRLKAGPHVLAATVLHFGPHAGWGQLGGPAFLLVKGEGRCGGSGADLGALVASDASWRCWHDVSREPCRENAWDNAESYTIAGPAYTITGPGEQVEGARVPWGFADPGYDDRAWPAAREVGRVARNDWAELPLGHVLQPSALPPLDEEAQRFARVADAPAEWRDDLQAWIAKDQPVVIGAKKKVRFLLDRGELTNAYTELTVSGGKGAVVRVVSVEALFEGRKYRKGNRDEVAGKQAWGYLDKFQLDGGPRRTFTTLWFRPYRYLEVTVETTDEPLTLERVTSVFTGYPLRQRAKFRAEGPRADAFRSMWEISWRTARLCAHETYFDCPHYEQLQYVGDTRIQALFSYLLAGDDRLARKAIDDFHGSRIPDGLTQSRFPTNKPQVIPTFSLYWIGMLHDFRVYRGDLDFLRPYLPAAREVLAWFERRRRTDGMLGWITYWPFFDWVPQWKYGYAPQDEDGGSALLTLLFARAARWQAGLERACGYPELARRWLALARSLTQATLAACWDIRRDLLADTAAKKTFSQHGQVEAVLAGAWRAARARGILARAFADAGVTGPGTLYYRYYVAQALKAADMRSAFFDLLKNWEALLHGTGLTTWPETDGDARSDCHAWAVTPGIEFFETILGIAPDPAVHGFARLVFQPELGPLPRASGTAPTPVGRVRVRLRSMETGGVEAWLDTPVPAFVPALARTLRPGSHTLKLPPARRASPR